MGLFSTYSGILRLLTMLEKNVDLFSKSVLCREDLSFEIILSLSTSIIF